MEITESYMHVCVCTRVLAGEVGMSELSLKWNSNMSVEVVGGPLGGDLQEGFPTPPWEGRGMKSDMACVLLLWKGGS